MSERNPSVLDRASYVQRFYDEITEAVDRTRVAVERTKTDGDEGDWQLHILNAGEVLNLVHDTLRASSAMLARIRAAARKQAEGLEKASKKDGTAP